MDFRRFFKNTPGFRDRLCLKNRRWMVAFQAHAAAEKVRALRNPIATSPRGFVQQILSSINQQGL
jgi:hypothetical protein